MMKSSKPQKSKLIKSIITLIRLLCQSFRKLLEQLSRPIEVMLRPGHQPVNRPPRRHMNSIVTTLRDWNNHLLRLRLKLFLCFLFESAVYPELERAWCCACTS